MKKEEQRIAIAKACGWKSVGYSLAGVGGFPPAGYEKNPLPSPEDHEADWRIRFGYKPGEQWFSLPDFVGDLNAMHYAEGFLTYQQEFEYHDWLKKLCPNKGRHTCYESVRASAEIRAEAFLRTLNLWEK